MNTQQQENDPLYIQSTKTVVQSVSYHQLFRFASKFDMLLMSIGSFGALLNGASMPMFSLIFGEMANSFQSASNDQILHDAQINCIYFLIIGVATFIVAFSMFSTFTITAERQGIQFRKIYFKALLSQEVGWYDTINPNQLNSKLATEVYDVQDAIGQKFASFLMSLATFISGILIGYIKGWLLALVITGCMPVLAFSILIISGVQGTQSQVTSKCEAEAAGQAEQALNAIKTVKMLDGEHYECLKYSKLLLKSASTTIKFSLYYGMALGLIFGEQLWAYALGFWYGAKLISNQTINRGDDVYNAGDVLVIFFSILMGSFSLGQLAPCLASFAKGKQSAAKAFSIIDRKSIIKNPLKPKSMGLFNGELKFKDVSFTYPSGKQILNKINFSIVKGTKIAFVGASGCGKSTVFQLIERFYDVGSGQVQIGETDIRDFNLVEYRSQIGMVGQEPVLFAGSIRENLMLGKPDATDEEMIAELKTVNAWDFIEKMDKQLDTYVGIGGSQLSGGQKQRVAIARALLKKPKLLLLDEATSALDRTNEKLIQATLDEVSQGITTIVIAHRLSTIRNADFIYVFENGSIVESGRHQELMSRKAQYYNLAQSQVTIENVNEQQQQQQQQQQEQIVDNNENKKLRSLSQIVMQMNPINDENNIVEEIVENANNLNKLEIHKLINKKSNENDDKIMIRLFSYNSKERIYLIIGLFSALINGCMFPLFSIFLSDLIAILIRSNPALYFEQEKQQKMQEVQEESDKIGLIFFLLGIGYWLFTTIENFCLNVCAERLTTKLRMDTFQKLLRMPIPYFDIPENNAGTLTARLNVDCKIIQGLTSTILGFKVQNFSALICGLTIAFSSSWALTLIALGISPISYISQKLRAKYFIGAQSNVIDAAYKDSGNLIMESVTNIRTVYSFGNENIILNAYDKKVQGPMLHAKKQGYLAGFSFGTTSMQLHIINACIFYLGTLLIVHNGLTVQDMYRTIFGITFAVMGGAKDSHFASDVDKSKKAAKNIFDILDSVDEYQMELNQQCKKLTNKINGKIELKDISFKYASRDRNVFTNLSLIIPAGQKVSFVGSSGCGKSTILQMLMRFYDPDVGQILIDGIDIKDYDIRHLRRSLAIVSQEPVLFNGTIAENIKYNQTNIEQPDIELAAQQANAYDFIINNAFETVDQCKQDENQGFNKQVGLKGNQISGGQKQRIAIARAILRNGCILLLDEATSALDSKTEELVQESLNKFMFNKTTLTVAHRISTIKDSDIIYVFDNGQIVETGKYQSLLDLEGYFYRLHQGINV